MMKGARRLGFSLFIHIHLFINKILELLVVKKVTQIICNMNPERKCILYPRMKFVT